MNDLAGSRDDPAPERSPEASWGIRLERPADLRSGRAPFLRSRAIAGLSVGAVLGGLIGSAFHTAYGTAGSLAGGLVGGLLGGTLGSFFAGTLVLGSAFAVLLGAVLELALLSWLWVVLSDAPPGTISSGMAGAIGGIGTGLGIRFTAHLPTAPPPASATPAPGDWVREERRFAREHPVLAAARALGFLVLTALVLGVGGTLLWYALA